MNENLAYQEEMPEELIDGRIVAMAPPTLNHNRVAGNIFSIFHEFLRGKVCEAFSDGVSLYLAKNEYYIPDVMVVCDPDKMHWDGIHGAPDLVVEVLSPRTMKQDRGHKKEVYERCGVGEYWIVHPLDQTIEQYLLRDGKFVLQEIYTLHTEYEQEEMPGEAQKQLPREFRCSLYGELVIRLEDVFDRVRTRRSF